MISLQEMAHVKFILYKYSRHTQRALREGKSKVGVDKVAPSHKVNLKIFPKIRVTSMWQFSIYLQLFSPK